MKKKQKSFGETIMNHLETLQEEKDDDKDDEETSTIEKDDDAKDDDEDKDADDKDKEEVTEEEDEDDDDKDDDKDDDDDDDKDDDDKEKVDEEAKPDFDKDAEEVDSEEGVDEVDDAADAVKTKAKRGGAAGASAKDDQTQEKADKVTQENWLEDFNDLCNEEANLSTAFQKKAAKIFKHAVTERAKKMVREEAILAEENFEEQISAVAEDIENDTIKSVGKFLDYAVEEWITKNELSIEKSLRSHMMEEFIDGLHTLFTEHYIDVPESKVNVLEDLEAKNKKLKKTAERKVKTLQEQLTESDAERKRLQRDFDSVLKEQERLKKEAILAEECGDMTITQQAQLKDLLEESYDMPVADFSRKLDKAKRVLVKREQVSRKNTNANNGILGTSHHDVTLSEDKEDKPKRKNSGAISKYADHLSRMSKYDRAVPLNKT